MPLLRINNRIVFFVHIPKTGGTSIENALAGLGQIALHRKPLDGWVPPQHWHADIYNIAIPADFYDFGFLVCRNPYVRLFSEFRHRSKRDDERRKLGFGGWVEKILEDYRADSFIKHNHIRPQVEFLSTTIKVFGFEDGLQPVIDAVAAFCGVASAKIARDKVSPPLPADISQRALDTIASFYARDFERFGYDRRDVDVLARYGVTIT